VNNPGWADDPGRVAQPGPRYFGFVVGGSLPAALAADWLTSAWFTPPGGGNADGFTREVIRRVQRDGTCRVGGSTWQGLAAMRVSVSNWSTTPADIDRSAEIIRRAVEI
jgi:hypothetical protein